MLCSLSSLAASFCLEEALLEIAHLAGRRRSESFLKRSAAGFGSCAASVAEPPELPKSHRLPLNRKHTVSGCCLAKQLPPRAASPRAASPRSPAGTSTPNPERGPRAPSDFLQHLPLAVFIFGAFGSVSPPIWQPPPEGCCRRTGVTELQREAARAERWGCSLSRMG